MAKGSDFTPHIRSLYALATAVRYEKDDEIPEGVAARYRQLERICDERGYEATSQDLVWYFRQEIRAEIEQARIARSLKRA